MTLSAARTLVSQAASHATLVLSVGAPVLLFLFIGQCNATRQLRSDLKAERTRTTEREQLQKKGQIVAQPLPEPDFRADYLAARAESDDLRTALDAALKAAPKAKPIVIVHASTGPVPVVAPTRNQLSDPEAGLGRTSTTPVASCLLSPGDEGEIRVDEVGLRTGAGNDLLLGSASAWKVGPTPVRLFGGSFRAPLTSVSEKAPPAQPVARWGAGPWAGAGQGGLALGAAVAPPPLRLWGFQLDLSAGGGVTRDGHAQGSAQLIVRP